MGAVVLTIALLGAWQAYVELFDVESLILPAPTEIGQALWDDRGLLASNLAVTAQEVGFGIVAAFALGFGLAIAIHFSRRLRDALYPLLVGSQAVPIVILAPLLVYWLGFGILPKVAIIAVICFFPIVVTTTEALDRVDPDVRKLMRTLDATRWQTFRFAELPHALPGALAGARIAVAVAVIGAVLAEESGSTAGLGRLITQASNSLQTARGYAAALLLAAFAVALFVLFGVAQRRLLAHRPKDPVR